MAAYSFIPHDVPPHYIGRFEVLRRLGRGGMAEVFLARADGIAGFEKLTALKLLNTNLVGDRAAEARFVREARVGALLDHPNLAQVNELGRVPCVGTPATRLFIAMEYVHGEPLTSVIRQTTGGAMSIRHALTVAVDVCAALHYMHLQYDLEGQPLGLVHCDLSPQNVMVRFDGVVKLLDLGVAATAATAGGPPLGLQGTAGYMSPEQCRGEPVDHRSDVYAMGILLHELTTGRSPFDASDHAARIRSAGLGEIRRPRELVPNFPEPLDAIIVRALELERAHRYPSARALAAELEAFAAEHRLRLSRTDLGDYLGQVVGMQPYPTPAADPTAPVSMLRDSGDAGA